MKLTAEVDKQESTGSAVKITATNIQSITQPKWFLEPAHIVFTIPFGAAKSYPIGRKITITITPQ